MAKNKMTNILNELDDTRKKKELEEEEKKNQIDLEDEEEKETDEVDEEKEEPTEDEEIDEEKEPENAIDVSKVKAALANKRGDDYMEQVSKLEVIAKHDDGVVIEITKVSGDATKKTGDFLTTSELENVEVNNESTEEDTEDKEEVEEESTEETNEEEVDEKVNNILKKVREKHNKE